MAVVLDAASLIACTPTYVTLLAIQDSELSHLVCVVLFRDLLRAMNDVGALPEKPWEVS